MSGYIQNIETVYGTATIYHQQFLPTILKSGEQVMKTLSISAHKLRTDKETFFNLP